MKEKLTKRMKVKNYGGVLVLTIDHEDAKYHNIKEGEIIKVTIEPIMVK